MLLSDGDRATLKRKLRLGDDRDFVHCLILLEDPDRNRLA